MSSTQPSTELLWDLIKEIRYAMLTTHGADGHLHSRPVTTQNKDLDEDRDLWFFMSRSGSPLRDILADGNVNVAYAHPGKDSYVSVAGQAELIENSGKKEALWNKMAQAWFPGGVNDPDLALVRVRIAHAHYWDVRENKLVQLFEMAKASVTGKPPKDMGRSGEVRP